MKQSMNRSEEGMLPADDTGGREARSPATAAAARARRARQIRDRHGLNSGATPAATAAAVPVITPAVGTADAMDGGVELSTGEGDAGDVPATGAVREAIKALSRTNLPADLAAAGQAGPGMRCKCRCIIVTIDKSVVSPHTQST